MRKVINFFFGRQYDGELSGLEALKILAGCAVIIGLILSFGPALMWLYTLTH